MTAVFRECSPQKSHSFTPESSENTFWSVWRAQGQGNLNITEIDRSKMHDYYLTIQIWSVLESKIDTAYFNFDLFLLITTKTSYM